jgi:hypothetical protein
MRPRARTRTTAHERITHTHTTGEGRKEPVFESALFDELDRLCHGAGVLHVEEENEVCTTRELVKDFLERRDLEQSGCVEANATQYKHETRGSRPDRI